VKKYFGLSNYHLGVLALYSVITPLFFIFLPGKLRYDLPHHLWGAIVIIIAPSLLGVYFFHRLRVILAVLYGVMFAFPEEIFFRGIIQGFFQEYYTNIATAVLLSALIFGIAHLFNGARGFYPLSWNWKLSGITFLAGLLLGLIFALTNSLFIPTLLHAFLVAGFKLFEV